MRVWPEAISNAGAKAAALLFAASGSKTAAAQGSGEPDESQLIDLKAPPAGVEPTTYRLGGGRSIH